MNNKKLTVSFITSSFNPHLEPLARKLNAECKNFYYISCCNCDQEIRSHNKFSLANENYVIAKNSKYFYENAKKAINSSDVVIFGSGDNDLLKFALKRPLFFRMSEHINKNFKLPFLHFFSIWKKRRKESRNGAYLLCASSKAANDYSKCFLYKNKKITWGYFPDGNLNIQRRNTVFSQQTLKLLWCGRMLSWKHPDDCLVVCDTFYSLDIPFEMKFIGDGPFFEELICKCKKKPYFKSIKFSGLMTHSDVLKEMNESDICLFTSDITEGWGAVLNEYLSSGCIVFASEKAGATNFLVEDNVNGFTYKNKKQLIKKTLFLSKNFSRASEISREASKTISNEWNGENAAIILLQICNRILQNDSIYNCKNKLGKFIK